MEVDRERDEQTLQEFGYRQELTRTLGSFSSFALSFSVISVTTGIFANYDEGLRLAGPAFIWTWLVVGAGQFIVAMLFARLAQSIPLSGYAYHWTRQLAGPRLGWWAGWMMIVQFLAGLTGACYALANYSAPYLGLTPTSSHLVLLTAGLLVTTALLNHFGIALASRVNNFSVAAEILGTFAVGFLLLGVSLVRGTHPLGFLLSHPDQPGGTAYLAPFAFSSVMSAWTLTGFESAANLAEETHAPQHRIPNAIITSELVSVILGFLALVGFTLAIPSTKAVSESPTPLLLIMSAHFPSSLVNLVMLFVLVSIFACVLANLTTVTRTVWAMARDHQLPVSDWLAEVNVRKVPARAMWLVTAICVLFVMWAKVETVITGIATLAGFITYAVVAGAALWATKSPGPSLRIPDEHWAKIEATRRNQGRALDGRGRDQTHAGMVPRGLALATLVWIVLVVAMLSVPRPAQGNALATLVVIAIGAVCYFWGRERE